MDNHATEITSISIATVEGAGTESPSREGSGVTSVVGGAQIQNHVPSSPQRSRVQTIRFVRSSDTTLLPERSNQFQRRIVRT